MRQDGFFVGLWKLADACHFERICVSINKLRTRRKRVDCPRVLVDSGAFTEIHKYGRYRHGVSEYAMALARLWRDGIVSIAAAVAQDYMCEPFMLEKTGLTIADHQRLTIERYDALVAELELIFGGPCPFHVMPVLQGFFPADYWRHVEAYGDRLKPGMWVGVGSVCKRNGTPARIVEVLWEIHQRRPDLELHGFGVKLTAIEASGVRELLATSDSMAWSLAARYEGRDGNDWHEARRFADRIETAIAKEAGPWQMSLAV